MTRPIVRETIIDRRAATPIRWGAVFAGTITAVGVWILLELLGTGIGMSIVDSEGANLRDIGIATGVWSLIAPLVALFLGALVGARLAGTRDRRIGALHGMVMWALTSVIGVFLVISMVGAIASGAMRVGKAAATSAADRVAEHAATAPNADESAPPPATEDTAAAARQRVAEFRARAKEAGLHAAPAAGRAMLWGGLAMLVALLASLFGGALGVPRAAEVAVTTVTETVPPAEPPPPVA